MSLILEALRKSEAERRRGQSPNLYVELPPVTRTQRRTVPAWLWLALGASAVAVVVWWMQGDDPRPPSPTVATSTRTDAPTSDVPAATARDAALARREAPSASTIVRPVEPAPIRAPAVATPPVVAPATPLPDARPDPVATTPRPEPAAEPSTPEQTIAPPPPAPIAAASNDRLMRLSDLPAEQRKQLPPLKVSMHMWDDTPARRFVIIDGSRYAEGDRIGDTVVSSIVSDGVVLDWNGAQLKLPIR